MKESIPTKAEMEILQVLWRVGPATVRQIHQEIGGSTGYTTTLKLLQIMTEKGLVGRETDAKAHIYEARVTEQNATGDFLRELVQRVFRGSALQLVMHALSSQKASRAELKEIRDLLDEMEGR